MNDSDRFDYEITRQAQEQDDITCVWVEPPIPNADHWQAFRDPEGRVGTGRTREEAIEDLKEKEQ